MHLAGRALLIQRLGGSRALLIQRLGGSLALPERLLGAFPESWFYLGGVAWLWTWTLGVLPESFRREERGGGSGLQSTSSRVCNFWAS